MYLSTYVPIDLCTYRLLFVAIVRVGYCTAAAVLRGKDVKGWFHQARRKAKNIYFPAFFFLKYTKAVEIADWCMQTVQKLL